ncbi:DegV family protein [Paenibacillus sp. GSMTC-2017]|uniref:DegV family protein n=1 Tax=Paenibacillus sp. GSMTC-2017 TaxID=2794350 RepID=UPI0018D7F695|nr:DegV family protein [Paenibacillus sp. GSMTC-2017]MBH5316746.1 DegV family protein [Paenibacillus sp. GSMTC-2017]
MGNVRIVTDSTADIPVEVRERLGISMVPLKVLFGEETFQDAITIHSDQFYKKLKASDVLPTTSQPSPLEFSETYERLLAEDQVAPILSIHLSAAMSGTHQSATIAQSMIEQESDITIVDSKSASYGIGIQVVKAAKMAQAGESKERILEEVARLQNDVQLYFLVDSLEYLQKGGRIGRASAMIGSILNIKPILSLDKDGGVYSVDKVRGSKKAMTRIAELLKDAYGDDPVGMVLAYTDNKEPADELAERLKSALNVKEVDYTTVGAVIGVHTGPGTAAVFMYRV